MSKCICGLPIVMNYGNNGDWLHKLPDGRLLMRDEQDTHYAEPVPQAEKVEVAGEIDPAVKLLASVMHLWVDGYIEKSGSSAAPLYVSVDKFKEIESFLATKGITVDCGGWHVAPASGKVPNLCACGHSSSNHLRGTQDCGDIECPCDGFVRAPTVDVKGVELPPLDFHGHGHPNCDCDLPGGDPECTIKPPYVNGYDQRCDQLKSALARASAADAKVESLEKQLSSEKESKDTAYSERDRLVCAISKMFPSWLERHPDADVSWEDDWRWIVFVTFPTGQASWHIHDSELIWFDHLERKLKANSWDGHSTAEKYARIERFERIGTLEAARKAAQQGGK